MYEVLKEFDPSINLKSAEEELKSLVWIKRKVVKTKCLLIKIETSTRINLTPD